MWSNHHYGKDCANSTGISLVSDQTPTYSSPLPVTEMVTATYAVPQSSLVTNLKELARVKQTN